MGTLAPVPSMRWSRSDFARAGLVALCRALAQRIDAGQGGVSGLFLTATSEFPHQSTYTAAQLSLTS